MKKRKSSNTLAGMRELLLRIAVLIVLVGVGGAWIKERALAQTTNSFLLTPQKADELGASLRAWQKLAEIRRIIG